MVAAIMYSGIGRAATADGLVARYTFDSSNYSNSSPLVLAGTPNGSARIVDEHGGKALFLDGNNSWVSVPNDPQLSPDAFAIALWVKPESGPATTIIEKGVQRAYWLAMLGNGKIEFGVRTATGDVVILSDLPIQMREWNHVCATFDGTQMKLYIAGHLQGTVGEVRAPLNHNTYPLAIGSYLGYASWGFFFGYIDDIRIWKRALLATEVADVLLEGTISPIGIEVNGVDGSDIYLNGHYTGKQTPTTITVVNPGHYWIGIGNDQYGYQHKQAFISAGRPVTVGFSPNSGWLPQREWKVLAIYVRNVVMDDENGVATAPLTNQEIETAQSWIEQANRQNVEPLSRRLLRWSVTHRVLESTTGHLTKDYGYPLLDRIRVLREAGLLDVYESEFDSAFFSFSTIRTDGSVYGGGQAYAGGAFASVPSNWLRAGFNASGVWFHEWLHGASWIYASRGWYPGYRDADGAEAHGYPRVNGDWWNYYRDLTQGKVAEAGRYVGLSPMALIEGGRLVTTVLPREFRTESPLLINGATAPTIVFQPAASTGVMGGNIALSVGVSGAAPLTYQWSKEGANIIGATNSTMTLSDVLPSDAGSYTCVISNSVGSVTSTAAALSVLNSRITNMSVRTSVARGQTFIVGFVTDGAKPVLARGISPGLNDAFPQYFGAADVMADPQIELYNAANVKVAENNDWSGGLTGTMASVGAFPLRANSKDAALLTSIDGPHTIQLKGSGSGVVLVDCYDATSSYAPRFKNVSARNQIGAGTDILVAGFVIDGSVSKTVLIRGVGPTLRDLWGLSGVLADPRLEIYRGDGTRLMENDNWEASLSPVFSQVGAFDFTPGSRDAALTITLPSGSYTAQLSGVGGTTGDGLLEVYDVSTVVPEILPASNYMALIPAGSFVMGDTFSEGGSPERPTRTVTVSAFHLAKTPVTWVEWKSVCNWGSSRGYTGLAFVGSSKGDTHPVQTVSWYEAVMWLNAKSEKEGLIPVYYTDDAQTKVYRAGNVNVSAAQVKWTANGYRLPTEAEWEYAARGGLDGKRFPWGDTITHQQANYFSSANYSYDVSPVHGYNPKYASGGTPYTSPVGSFASNGYGLFDMTGNVLQWCWDWYGSYSGSTDPHGVSSGSSRILRGGGWRSNAAQCRISNRSTVPPNYTDTLYIYFDVGFRPARNAVHSNLPTRQLSR